MASPDWVAQIQTALPCGPATKAEIQNAVEPVLAAALVVKDEEIERLKAERDEWRERSEIVDQARGNDAVEIERLKGERKATGNCPEHGDLCGRPNWTGYCRWRAEGVQGQSPDFYDALSAAESRIGELEQALPAELEKLQWKIPFDDDGPLQPDLSPCDECGRPMVICWWAASDLWNTVNGSPDGMLCPPCFNRKAAELGLPITWKAALPGEDDPSMAATAEAEYQARRAAEERLVAELEKLAEEFEAKGREQSEHADGWVETRMGELVYHAVAHRLRERAAELREGAA